MNTLFQPIKEVVDFYNTPIVKRRLESKNPVRGAFECAYFDTQRTFRGMGKVPQREQIKQEIFEVVERFYNMIIKDFGCWSIADFDGTHKLYCEKIIAVGGKYNFTIYFGQAQKIINMFFKYILLIDERLNEHLNYFHVPLDSVILNGIIKNETDKPTLTPLAEKCLPWSKINCFELYIFLQDELRKFYDCPIIWEFTVWAKW